MDIIYYNKVIERILTITDLFLKKIECKKSESNPYMKD